MKIVRRTLITINIILLVGILVHFFKQPTSKLNSRTSNYKYIPNYNTAIEELFQSDLLLHQGLELLSHANPNLNIIKPEDASKLNSRITNFDIALLPLLENIPNQLLSNNDIGIHNLTNKGITYTTFNDRTKTFIPFSPRGSQLFKEIFEATESSPVFENNRQITQETFVLSSDAKRSKSQTIKLLKKGKSLLLKYFKNEDLIKNSLPNHKANLGSLYLLISTLNKTPKVLQSNTPRQQWFWIAKKDGIEFINKNNLSTELVKFNDDPKIAELKDFSNIKKLLITYQQIIRGNFILNHLDKISYTNKNNKMTKYDSHRHNLFHYTLAQCPLTYTHAAIYNDIELRETRTTEDISSFRFSLKELKLMYNARSLIPKTMHNEKTDSYFSYRPDFSMFFAGEYTTGNSTFVISPILLININNSKKVVSNIRLQNYLNQFDNKTYKELAFARVILHEKSHTIYRHLSEKNKKEYSSISWDINAWKNSSSITQAKKTPTIKSDFLLTYPDWPPYIGHDSSEEDFSDHFATYIMFGPIFFLETKNNKPLKSKYTFIKKNIFGGIEFKNNFKLKF